MRGVLAVPKSKLLYQPRLGGETTPAHINTRHSPRFPAAVVAELAFHFRHFNQVGAEHRNVVVLPGCIVFPTMDEDHYQQTVGRVFVGEPFEHRIHLLSAPKPALVVKFDDAKHVVGGDFDAVGLTLRCRRSRITSSLPGPVLLESGAAGQANDETTECCARQRPCSRFTTEQQHILHAILLLFSDLQTSLFTHFQWECCENNQPEVGV